jgi:hypothetical protein
MKVANFQNFSIAMDDSNEAGAKAKRVAFVRGIDMKSIVTEELAA